MPRYPLRWALPTLATAGVATIATFILRHEEDVVVAGEVEPELPTFSMRQVQQHSKPWIVYRHGVYDVTEFARDHPGGTKILQAAGKSVELFWQQSEPHHRTGVSETLEELRVGNLKQEDFDWMEEIKSKQSVDSTALQRFFFIEGASMLPVDVDLDAFKLKICGVSGQEVSLSMNELKTRFKQQKVTTTIRFATPRTGEDTVRVPAEWTGVLLSDVLVSVGVKTVKDVEQVRFEALDTDKQGRPFGASIPAATAVAVHIQTTII